MQNMTEQHLENDVNPSAIDYDVAISGGGVVGCLAALALSQFSHLRIALFEAYIPDESQAENTQHQFDERVIALAGESLHLLSQLGIDIGEIVTQSIEHIHVSDKGHLGQVQLSAKEFGRSELGKVVSIKAFGLYLLNKVKQCSNVTYYAPVKIKQAHKQQACIKLTLENLEQTKQATMSKSTKLVLICDGANSPTSALLGFNKSHYDYGQSAIITNVNMQLPHNNYAFERFTSQGPIAFLPMYANNGNAPSKHAMSVVWCINNNDVDAVMNKSEAQFIQQLQPLFGYKLGKIEAISKVVKYPLILSQTQNFVGHRSICLGNAAQSLHPIAGQGFNLGIRDVFDLVNTIDATIDVGAFSNTQAYKKSRQHDKFATVNATDSLVSIFSNQYFPLVVGRNISLLAMNKSKLLKQQFANFAMGQRNKVKSNKA
ncbi:FAD-dependent monooxygenase [Glaciecola sp. 2405UD65-10]|uniref:FAD-dependent monooxygenase n=1 Tax=Glaciecola sp. 2405UD65-10 TaxID=3397244 RepID=UPI003B5A80DD